MSNTIFQKLALGLFLALPTIGWAQTPQEIRGVPQPPQVIPVGDQGYAVYYRSEAGEDGQDVYAMRLMDPALKVKHQFMLDIPVGAAPLPRLTGKTTMALPFHNQGAAELSLYTVAPQSGTHLQRDLTAVPDRRRVPVGTPLVAMTPTEGYCIVQPFRRDTAGYAVTILDKALKTQWSKMYFPADLRQHVPLQVAVSKDVVTLVMSDSYVVNSNTPKQRNITDLLVLGLDPATGKVLYRTPVRQEKLVMLPAQLLPLSDGRIIATGFYAQPQATRADSVLGVFMTTYRADGKPGTPVLTPWAEIGNRVGDPALGRHLYERKANFQLRELLATTGTEAKLVAEYSTGKPGPFVVFSYTPAGTLGSVYPIARSFNTISTADEQRHSSYRGVIGTQGEAYLLYTGVESNQEYAYASVLAETAARSATRASTKLEALPELPAYTTEVPMARSATVDKLTGKLMGLQQKMGAVIETADKVINGPQAPVPVYYQPDQLTNFAVGPPGQVLVYRYEPSRKMLRYYLQPLK